ncbi:hypothetical protein CCACVL1_28475, partial [Corchorus capsularis]
MSANSKNRRGHWSGVDRDELERRLGAKRSEKMIQSPFQG